MPASLVKRTDARARISRRVPFARRRSSSLDALPVLCVRNTIHLEPLVIEYGDDAALVRQRDRCLNLDETRGAGRQCARERLLALLPVDEHPAVEREVVGCGIQEGDRLHLRRLCGVHERTDNAYETVRLVAGG
jgi:hypothetical protein